MAPSARIVQWPRFGYLVGLMALVAWVPGIPAPADALEEAVSPAQPPITITIKGGAGTIKADRAWYDGDQLCWESRGVRNCMLRRWVSSIKYSGVPD